ncbi:MAG: zf-HC2 domain-containing protein [Armatimonadetes bacterium]|nr:zf-HC2 domain-containing protein [Armatimonadota bacterium]
MSCRLFRSRAVAFTDGELSAEECRFMEQHARGCPDCATELAAIERETQLYAAALRTHAAPAGLAEEVMTALEGVHRLPEPVAPPQRAGIPLRWVLSTAAAAALVLFALLGGMGTALNTRRAAVAEPGGWSIVPASESVSESAYHSRSGAVQAEGFRPSPTGGPIYSESRASARHRPPSDTRYRLTSFDGRPLHHAAPDFQVQQYGAARDSAALNKELSRPQAVTEAEQQGLNEAGVAVPPTFAGSPAEPMRSGVSSEVLQAARSATPDSAPPPGPSLRAASAVLVDSTDARVILTVGYEKEDDRYVTVYDADFKADYVIRAPDTKDRLALITVTFPFPSGCSTVSGSSLTVDEKPDDDHTAYSIAGIRWTNWFRAKEMKTISVTYRARGQGNYRYVLDKVNLTRRLRFLMRIDGVEPGREIEVPADSLPPGKPGSDVGGRWDYAWDYQRLLTTKDIAVNFPTRESPSVAAGRVMQTVEQYLPVARLAPIFLVVFLGALALGGVWRREHALRVEELGLLGIAFLLFYPLFLFGAGYVGRDAALCGALGVVAVLSALYLARVHGAAVAGRTVLLEVVLLGAFTYGLFDRALTGLVFTGGVTLLVAYLMLLHGRRAAEAAQGDPAVVARAAMPRAAETPAEDGPEV